MSTESAWLKFRRFMTPGRTLIALFFLFIALPSAIVWSGVASFGPGKGAGKSEAAKSEASEAKPASELDLAREKAKSLMATASGGSGGGSESGAKSDSGGGSGGGGGSDQEAEKPKEKPAPAGLPAMNPIQIKPPIAQQAPSTLQQAGASARESDTKAQSSVSAQPMPMSPAQAQMSTANAASKASSIEAGNQTQAARAPSLEDKVRSALSTRLQGSGELTITYGGDVVERPSTPPTKTTTNR